MKYTSKIPLPPRGASVEDNFFDLPSPITQHHIHNCLYPHYQIIKLIHSLYHFFTYSHLQPLIQLVTTRNSFQKQGTCIFGTALRSCTRKILIRLIHI